MTENGGEWQVSDSWPSLTEDAVHVFKKKLDVSPSEVKRLAPLLSDDERERAARFYFDADRRRFTVARGCLRLFLGRFLARAPEELVFAYGKRGKPSLTRDFLDSISFNISHSGELALLAFSRGGSLGVDVEYMRKLSDADAIAQRNFSPAEYEDYRSVETELRPLAFYHAWTRKEAFIKATGEGLYADLASFDVTLNPGEAPRIRSIRDNSAGTAWCLYHLEPGPGYVGALVAEAPTIRLKCWDGDRLYVAL